MSCNLIRGKNPSQICIKLTIKIHKNRTENSKKTKKVCKFRSFKTKLGKFPLL